jgi:hypothetical protein
MKAIETDYVANILTKQSIILGWGAARDIHIKLKLQNATNII